MSNGSSPLTAASILVHDFESVSLSERLDRLVGGFLSLSFLGGKNGVRLENRPSNRAGKPKRTNDDLDKPIAGKWKSQTATC